MRLQVTPSIEPLVDDRFNTAESPVWDEARNRLLWCSITDGTIHALGLADGRRERWGFDGPVPSFGLCRSGRLVVALADAVILFDTANGARETIATVTHAAAPMRLNDGKVGPDGAFWVGSMDESPEKRPLAHLYRVTRDGAEPRLDGLVTSNGLAWSPDGTTMFHTDTRGPWIDRWRFDPGTGAMSDRQRVATLDEGSGRPDGGACDAEGFYWSAGVTAGRLNRFAPDGTLERTVPLPVRRPTMPCFGGEDLRTLFVTSLRGGMTEEQLAASPLSGGVLSMPAPVAGTPVHAFRD